MLESIQVVLFGVLILGGLGLILGLIRPVLVLWFLDRFNRLSVIKVYGSVLLITGLILIILWVFENPQIIFRD